MQAPDTYFSFTSERFYIAQLNPIAGNIGHNLSQIMQAIDNGFHRGASVVVLPELCVSGYSPKDLLLYPPFVEDCLKANQQIAERSTSEMMIIWGNICANTSGIGKPLYNSVFSAINGRIDTVSHKAHLPNYDVFNEARYFEAASETQALKVTRGPSGEKLMLVVCEDLWSHPALQVESKAVLTNMDYASVLFRPNRDHVHAIIHIAASPFEAGKPKIRLEQLARVARAEGCPVVLANQVGALDDIIFDGHSAVVLPNNEAIILDGFDPHELATWQAPQQELERFTPSKPEEWFEAITLGIRDFVRKTKFEKVYIGLSGGVDSALVATLASLALGCENVTAVLMPGPYSSEHSVTDALKLAENLGIETETINITPIYEQFLSNAFGPSQGDLAEQNLQARIRGTTLMTLANRNNALVLTTGNKSELAVGYSTLYGDSCGALAPIGDLTKTQVYDLCHYINQQENQLIPKSILTKAPSAELAPNQKDEDELGPYAELDDALTSWLHASNLHEVSQIDPKLLQRLFRVEYKRQQSPLVLKLSERAFNVAWQYLVTQQLALQESVLQKL